MPRSWLLRWFFINRVQCVASDDLPQPHSSTSPQVVSSPMAFSVVVALRFSLAACGEGLGLVSSFLLGSFLEL